MKTISLLQLGDIHFPDPGTSALSADIKDQAMSPGLIASIASTSLEIVVRKIQRIKQDDQSIAGLLICGDLTTKGDIPGYEACLKYLSKSLKIDDHDQWANEALHAVPGNHDVDRDSTDPLGDNLLRKFDAIVAAWLPIRPSILPISRARTSEFTTNSCTLKVVSLNSCLGCGEWRRRLLPPGLPGPLADNLQQYFEAHQNTKEGFERLDTPAFYKDDLTDSIAELSSSDKNAAIVVLAHHNLLPQSVPRVDIYTEAINAGLARSTLLGLNRPVLYCHGHLHTDPIEVIHDARRPQSNVGLIVSVSAPLLTAGFNRINLHFGELGRPIGCSVEVYRLTPEGVMEEPDCFRVPFFTPIDAVECGLVGDMVRMTLEQLSSLADEVRFKAVADRLSPKKRSKTVADALLEAEWFGFVRIRNRDEDSCHWQIKKASLNHVI